MLKKTILMLIVFVLSNSVIAQVPNEFNYQAVVRDQAGELITNQNVNVQITILQGIDPGTNVYEEVHQVVSTNNGIINLRIGSKDATEEFSNINWGTNDYYLKIDIDKDGNASFVNIGTFQLLSVPYALYAKGSDYSSNAYQATNAIYSDTSDIANKLNEEVLYFTNTDTLFAVKDRNGNIVFAVFNDGVKVYVNEGAKGNVGGFAISGRGTGKASTEYSVLNVTPDSARFYLNEGTKGTPGGFAVSGRGTGKSVISDYLQITPDSTRIYINENATKGTPGGFAVSGRGTGKATNSDYFNISGTTISNLDTISQSQPRMLWYPKSEAFLVGRVLIEHPDSVGLNSVATGYESQAMGDYSQAMGYQSITRGDYSTAIGKGARADSLNSFAFGNLSLAIGNNSYAIGSGALAYGENSFALGSVGIDTLGNLKDSPKALGNFSFAMGLGTRSSGLGSMSIGANNVSTGDFATALGFTSTSVGNRSMAIGPYSRSYGNGSTAIGYRCETTENGTLAFAGGVGSVANAYGAVSFGAYCEANGARSVAMGDGCITDGFGSVAMGKGTAALATGAIAFGLNSVADGVRSVALGSGAFTNGKEGAFVVNATDQSTEKVSVHAIRDGQVVFVATGGYNFYASNDTAEQNAFVIQPSTGNIGIGTFNPEANNKLEINGGDLSMKGKTNINLNDGGNINITDGNINLDGSAGIFVNGNPVTLSDFVFEPNYNLESIEEHAEFMWREKHLPALKGVKEIERNGGKINILERREQVLEELEKAHIYIEQLYNRIKVLEEKNKLLEQNLELQKRVEQLEKIVLE